MKKSKAYLFITWQSCSKLPPLFPSSLPLNCSSYSLLLSSDSLFPHICFWFSSVMTCCSWASLWSLELVGKMWDLLSVVSLCIVCVLYELSVNDPSSGGSKQRCVLPTGGEWFKCAADRHIVLVVTFSMMFPLLTLPVMSLRLESLFLSLSLGISRKRKGCFKWQEFLFCPSDRHTNIWSHGCGQCYSQSCVCWGSHECIFLLSFCVSKIFLPSVDSQSIFIPRGN